MQSGELINGKTLTPRMSDRTKSFVELEKKTRESAKNRWMNTLGLNDLDRDWFSVYINSITSDDPYKLFCT
jgi:hypothetical protein